MPPPLLETHGLTKAYSGVVVLDEVDIAINRGEVLGLVGENGAGKSTLLSLITGLIAPTRGSLAYKGETLPPRWNPLVARKSGIASVHQEISLNPTQSVAENLFLGAWPTRYGLASHALLNSEAIPYLKRVCLDVDPRTKVERLSLGQMQLLELTRALVHEPDLLILDEVTSALDDSQVDVVAGVVQELRGNGRSVITVSHRMAELFHMCDRLTILKDGRHVASVTAAQTDEREVINLMLGRELSDLFPPKPSTTPESVGVRATDFSVDDGQNLLSFAVKKGAITGLGGLQGQGQNEVIRALFGLQKSVGTIEIGSRKVDISSPQKALKEDVIYVPHDRKIEGVHTLLPVSRNITLTNLDHLAPSSRLATIKFRAAKQLVKETIAAMRIKASANQEVRRLSGGNQQKVALAKWLPRKPQVLLLAEPTRGIDVGTKRELYLLLRELADSGHTILITSGDTLELVGMCEEILVMYEGKIVTILRGDQVNESTLVHASVTGTVEQDSNDD